MGKLRIFNFITLNGYYKGPNEDIGWHRHGAEENEYASKSMESGNGALLFGRITYEMMASYWPTEMAMEQTPDVAKGMNAAEKIVFSRTLKKAEWENTRLVNGNMLEEVRKMKEIPGKDFTILGSGQIVTQLAEAGLIDEYAIMLDPVALGKGTAIFSGLKNTLNLELTDSRVFKSGVVLLTCKPIK